MPATTKGRRAVDEPAAVNVHTANYATLAAMTREQVEALSDADRETRVDRLLADPTPMGLAQIGEHIFGHKNRDAMTNLRNNYLTTGEASANAFIAPDEELSDPNIRRPGDGLTSNTGGRPRWRAGDARTWGAGIGERLDRDLFPYPNGRKPTGRPRIKR